MITDCQYCWNTPCVCGWDWKDSDIEYLQKMKLVLDKVIQFKLKVPENLQKDPDKFFEFMKE